MVFVMENLDDDYKIHASLLVLVVHPRRVLWVLISGLRSGWRSLPLCWSKGYIAASSTNIIFLKYSAVFTAVQLWLAQ